MNLTGKEILALGYIFNVPDINVQQHSIDLNLTAVLKVMGDGFIPNDQKETNNKTVLAERKLVPLNIRDHCWHLEPGWYEVFFAQGCSMPIDQKMKIVHRSSLYRNGSQINSSLFDAGFSTDKIGSHMHVKLPIKIEFNARIASAEFYKSNIVDNLYDGQWQGYNSNQLT